jgi:PAS domain-containing protein
MTTTPTPYGRHELRARAVSRLQYPGTQHHAMANASVALRVLYDLASSPNTAADALALLHELQVHQVELDLQDEELRRSRAELELLLDRQMLLYEFAPAGLLTVDGNTLVQGLNRAGATLLGFERDFLLGRPLADMLAPTDSATLRATLESVTAGDSIATCDLALPTAPGAMPRRIHLSARLDPAGGGYLIGMMCPDG